ncbi:uncharacterized protein [Argopecten irradians]|uniref:uncharacterized protein n=1 Tax=Argopecten irradians TaxID=31199 RepID=UPI003723996E
MANQSWKPDIYVTDYSKTNPSNQVQQSSSESLRKQDDTSNLNSLLRVVSEFKQVDLTATLDEYKELKDELWSKSEQLQQAVKKLEVQQRESMRLRAQLQQAEKETEKYKADLKLKTEELQKTIDTEPTLTGIKSETPPDLSDPMRPSKIAEKYNELYDNEWTDAMEILGEMEKNEQINVEVLLETLKTCYRFCTNLAEMQMESLEMVLVNPSDFDRPKPVWGKQKKLNIPKSIHKQMKDLRKEMSTKTVDSIRQEQLTDKLGSNARKIPNFVSKCIEICWFMCVLDPPVVLGDEAAVGTTFDTNIYKPYTHSGTVVSYNVWPPLLLHQKGDLLVKGIVQPVKVMKKTTTEQMEVEVVGKTKKTKDQTATKSSVKQDNRLTKTPGYGHEYDHFEDVFAKMKPVTIPENRQYVSPEKLVTRHGVTYIELNGQMYDYELYKRIYQNPHQPKGDNAEGEVGNYRLKDAYGWRKPSTRPTGQSDDQSTGATGSKAISNRYSTPTNKLVTKNGIPFIELNGQLYDYELYKRIFQKHDETNA